MGGSGVILSQQTLTQLGPWLDHCLHREILTKHEDVELGRCILTHVHISCSHAYNSQVLFYHHYGSGYSFGYDFTPSIVSQALIIHPIKDQNTFYEIFNFYIRQKHHLQNNSSLKILINRENYVTFLSNIEFDLVRDVHYQMIDARWKLYIEQAVRSYIKTTRLIWHQRSFNWTLINGEFLFGYHRVIPSYGLELIVEVLLNAHSISVSSTRFVAVRKRFHICQPFAYKQRFDYREIINIETNENIHQLNLIVVSSNKDTELIRFINNFEREVLNYPSRHKHFTLTILYFSQNNQILDLIYQLSVKYISLIRLSVIDQNQTSYNRGLGRQLASKLFTNNQLLFFLDVDLVFTGQALDNTRRLMIHQLSISSCAVYFPIVYSVFSNMFLVDNRPIIDVQNNFGLFSIYGFGNVAVRKRDLNRIGGWEMNNHDWGIEDVNLFTKFVNLSVECSIFRAVEPDLKHYYHKKMCYGIENKIRQKMCYDAEANLLGSYVDMIDYIFDNKILND